MYKGGVGQANSQKIIRTLELALDAGCPFIAIWDSGGLRVDEGLAAVDAVGLIYQRFLDAQGLIPLISLVLGPCPGSLSLLPAASDLTVLAADKGGVFLQGPGITAAEEKPSLTAQDIGGADVHSKWSGLAAVTTKTGADAITLCRQLLDYIPDNADGFIYSVEGDDPNRSELSLDELASSLDQGYDVHHVLDAVFDKDSIVELYPDFATELYGGLARIGGKVVLFLANAAKELGLSSAAKIESLLSLAERFNYPLITFTDTVGFQTGTEMEKAGISRVAARIMAAFSSVHVTRINVVLGQAIGQAYLIFNSKVSGANIVYAWPTAEIGALRADSAVHLFKQDALENAKDPIADKEKIISEYRLNEMAPDKAASYGAVDEVIRPSATRPRIYSALQVLEGL